MSCTNCAVCAFMREVRSKCGKMKNAAAGSPCGGVPDCQNLVEFAPAGANKVSICFVRGRVPRAKHTTPGMCGICAQCAHKLCAQPGAAFSNVNPASRFAFESLPKGFDRRTNCL